MLHNDLISPDLIALSSLLRETAVMGKTYDEAGLTFLADAIDRIAGNAKTIESELRAKTNHLCATEARIEALTIPDYLRQTQINIAIREGRNAGVVVDLRDVFAREFSRQPQEATGERS